MHTEKNNILFISRAYGRHAGGMERLSYELISAFPMASKLVNETKPRTSLFAARAHSAIFAITIIPRAIIASKKVDIIHIGDPVLLLVAGFVKLCTRKKIICTVHGLDILYSNPLYQAYLKLFLPVCDRYIAISDFAKRKLENHGISAEKISVIPPGIVDHIYDANISREELANLLKQDISNKVIFATTGRLITRKGHAWFIEYVLPHLPENSLYIIAGNGPEFSAIANSIKNLNLENRALMLGRISDTDQKILLNTCDAFIQPNIAIWNDIEGFGIAPLEAALCARNVFAANIDGIPSAIHDDKNGALVESENAQAWISALTEYSKHASQNNQSREYTKQNFSWDVIKQKYEEVFTRVAQQ
ncbi:MAG: glycosyltransferase family 4 protein [Candidatus Andersenbacteria bacterium]